VLSGSDTAELLDVDLDVDEPLDVVVVPELVVPVDDPPDADTPVEEDTPYDVFKLFGDDVAVPLDVDLPELPLDTPELDIEALSASQPAAKDSLAEYPVVLDSDEPLELDVFVRAPKPDNVGNVNFATVKPVE
jgi:hypothetical protein